MVVSPLNLTAEQKQELLQRLNDVAHEQLGAGETIFLATQCKDDPRKFTIVADGHYDKKLEGVKVIFDNPEDFKNIFPEFTTTIPTNPPPGGPPQEHVDPYKVIRILTNPKIEEEEYIPQNMLDDNPETRTAYKGTLHVVLDMGKPVEIGCIWVQWYQGDERQAIFTLGASDNIKNFAQVPGFKGVYSSGDTTDYEGYNLSKDINKLTLARYFLVKVEGNTDSDWSTIVNIKVTKAIAVKSMETTVKKGEEPTTEIPTEPPTDPTTQPPTEPVSPPTPPITDASGNNAPMPAENRKYNSATAAKNKGRKLSGLVPLIDKTNKDGIKYPDIRKLFAQLGYPNLIKSFNYNKINYSPKENNNKGDENGKSLRLDFKEYMEQFMTIAKLKNQAKVVDDISCKYGGIHTRGDDDVYADCSIVRMKADGKTIASQLEPRHMAEDPFGYGEYFNVVNLDVGDTRGKFYVYMHIKVNDIPNNRVIWIFAIDKSGTGTQFELQYESIIYDGMGGDRVLKSPFAQWAYQVKKDLDKCNITVRMDAQGSHDLKKGSNYDVPCCIQIVDG